jgi:hypothetical protein
VFPCNCLSLCNHTFRWKHTLVIDGYQVTKLAPAGISVGARRCAVANISPIFPLIHATLEPLEPQGFEAHRISGFLENGHTNVARLSDLRTGRLYLS